MPETRKRPVRHSRKPYTRKDGTKVKGTTINPKLKKKTYYTSMFAECQVDCYIKARDEKEAKKLFDKIVKGDTAGITFHFNAMQLGPIISYVDFEEIKKDEWQYSLPEKW